MKKKYNLKTKKMALFFTLSLFMSVSAYSADWYVDIAKTGGDGLSWGTAFTNIKDAVTAAAASGDKILIAEGTYGDATRYSNTIVVFITGKVLTFEGGYLNDGSGTRDIVNNPTIVDGEGSLRGFFTTSSITINGITVKDTKASNKGSSAAGITGFNVTLVDVTIDNAQSSTTTSSTNDVDGAAIRAQNVANLTRCTITNSRAIGTSANSQTLRIHGSAVYARNNISINNCTITDNRLQIGNATGKTFSGAAIYVEDGRPNDVTITDSTISSNYISNGGNTHEPFDNVDLTFLGNNSVRTFLINTGSTATLPAGNNRVTVTNDYTNNGTVTVNAGASLRVVNAATGNLTYNVDVANTDWHLVASPVSGAGYSDTWITDNNIASGSEFSSNRAISTYDNSSNVATPVAGSAGHWRYTQDGDTGTFGTGVGYAFKKDAAASDFNISFTGSIAAVVSTPITLGVNNWNMVGNSFPSYMDVAAFITANTALLTGPSQAIHVWNGSTYTPLTTGYIQPGQAFFIDAASAGNISITKAMQSHQTGVTFYKTDETSLELSVTDGTSTRSTQINYLDNKTKGLDPGFDIRAFDGVNSEFSLTTQLLEDYQDLGFARQALPTSEMESAIVPLGVKAVANKEITFSLNTSNLPSGVNVYLENREENTFTLLTNGEVKITPQKNIDGVGIYYLQVSSQALSTETISLQGVSVYKTSNNTLRINGLSKAKASVKMFTILGKQVLNTTFDATGNNEISLPKLATGVYIVQIQSEQGNLNKKIILE